MNLKNIIIIQNKIDIVIKDNSASEQYNQIKKFVQGTNAQNSPIIPVSAQLKYNIDVVVEYLCKLPIPIRDFNSAPKFIVVRSFDVNHPGDDASVLKGGVAGGTLIRGVLRLGEEVEIRPGIISRNQSGEVKVTPILTRITTLKAEKNNLIYAVPGGLIGVGLQVDPFLTKGDRLVGRVIFILILNRF
jgi:translation initiation factor 2 subunit 3